MHDGRWARNEKLSFRLFPMLLGMIIIYPNPRFPKRILCLFSLGIDCFSLSSEPTAPGPSPRTTNRTEPNITLPSRELLRACVFYSNYILYTLKNSWSSSNFCTYAEPTMAIRIADFMVYLVYCLCILRGGLLGCSVTGCGKAVCC